jgi:hypothetical protein
VTSDAVSRAFLRPALGVIAFGLAMAYLESAVVVYLNGALDGRVGEIFPLRPVEPVDDLFLIEVGREVATLVMIASVGVLVGSTAVERLAWSAVLFGAWDIGYYAWLWIFSGWPGSPGTVDLLFLLPIPWVGPVWSPVAVSFALVGFGLAAGRRARRRVPIRLGFRHVAAGVGGGLLVILSYTLDSGRVIDGGLPGPYPWPVFAAGMLLAAAAAVDGLRAGVSQRGGQAG